MNDIKEKARLISIITELDFDFVMSVLLENK